MQNDARQPREDRSRPPPTPQAMKFLALAAVAALTAALFVATAAGPARANAFCPVTIAAVVNLAIVSRPDTYGVMLDLDPSDVASARLRIDSTTTRYAVDVNDLGPVGAAPTQVKRYFSLAPGDRIAAAWIESTGTSADARLECPITRPYAAGAPAPIDPRIVRDTTAAQNALRDSYSTKTSVLAATSFGPVQPLACAVPFAPPHALGDITPVPPPGAKAVHANGIALVRVDLDETSSVALAQIVRSSGFAPLDAAALAAARGATYKTQIFDCRPVASTFQFTVSFAGN
jgi:TonB family protein